MSSNLSFETLRAANCARLPRFKNARGEVVHNEDGSDWALSQWSNAVLGELGEAANLIKKIERKDFTLDDTMTDPKTHEVLTVREYLGKELADVQCYLDILAFRSGVDLGEATANKFNEISHRVGVKVFITDHNDVYVEDDDVSFYLVFNRVTE